MKRVFFFVLFFTTFFSAAIAQYFPIDTARLNRTYRSLLQDTQSRELQMDFFNAFPNNWYEYYNTYKYCSKEGYDLSMYSKANEHIQALEKCTTINDTLFCKKLIHLSVGATLDTDAPNYLKEIIHNTMESHECVFLYCLSQIMKGHQMQFWQFYWANAVYKEELEKEFKELYNRNKEKYPRQMKIMSVAFEYFHNGILFMSDFNNLD